MDAAEREALEQRLLEPFDPSEVKWKPAMVKGDRAMVLCYVDARVVQDRLDDVFGIAGWQDEYECLSNGSVVCRLKCKIGEEWITKTDVGGESEQPDEGDRRKAAFSDALKRAAVKYGVGRYLYRLPQQWVDYDPAKKRLAKTPQLPSSALPRNYKAQPAAARPAPTQTKPTQATAPAAPAKPADPTTGPELAAWLLTVEGRAVAGGYCQPGEFVAAVLAGVRKIAGDKIPASVGEWKPPVVAIAVQVTKEHARELKNTPPKGVTQPSRPAAAEPHEPTISEEQVGQIRHELDRTGVTWEECYISLNLPEDTTPTSLLARDARIILQRLAELADAVPVS